VCGTNTEAFLGNKEDYRCTRQAFTEDLCVEIKKWTAEGDQLIIALDVNEDVRTGLFSEALGKLGQKEAFTTGHGIHAPNTYERGSNPIDGIYVSRTLMGFKCGYTDFEFDHRCLWIDVPDTIAFGHKIPPIVRAAGWQTEVRSC
jgi:hypothetical protein